MNKSIEIKDEIIALYAVALGLNDRLGTWLDPSATVVMYKSFILNCNKVYKFCVSNGIDFTRE